MKAAARLEEERQQEEAEVALGENLIRGNEREKVMWEAIYGGDTDRKDHLSTLA